METCNVDYTTYPKQNQQREINSALQVIADHARASTFLIADGVTPEAEGRGYVLRRIIRRALRYGNKLLKNDPHLLSSLSQKVIEEMSDIYPEIKTRQSFIQSTLRAEEEKFFSHLGCGDLYF